MKRPYKHLTDEELKLAYQAAKTEQFGIAYSMGGCDSNNMSPYAKEVTDRRKALFDETMFRKHKELDQ